MSRPITKEDVIQNKKKAIRSMNNILEALINDSSNKHLKKADLISYWLQSYAEFIRFEEKFNPSKLLSYTRGDIIQSICYFCRLLRLWYFCKNLIE